MAKVWQITTFFTSLLKDLKPPPLPQFYFASLSARQSVCGANSKSSEAHSR